MPGVPYVECIAEHLIVSRSLSFQVITEMLYHSGEAAMAVEVKGLSKETFAQFGTAFVARVAWEELARGYRG